MFGELPATVTAGSVNDADARTQLQVDVVVLAPEDSGQPKRVLSLGEAKWDQTMTLGHLARLQRARDLLAVKGFDVTQARLACYSGAGFDDNLREAAQSDPRILLVGVADLYADSR